MKVMKGILSMSILTVIYVSAVVYAINANSADSNIDEGYWLLAADLYENQPSSWYTPEELRITKIIEYKETTSIHVAIPRDVNYTEMIEQQPIFKYKERFYQISKTDFTPALPEEAKGRLIYPASVGGGVCIAGGWVCVGYFGLRKRREGNEKE